MLAILIFVALRTFAQRAPASASAQSAPAWSPSKDIGVFVLREKWPEPRPATQRRERNLCNYLRRNRHEKIGGLSRCSWAAFCSCKKALPATRAPKTSKGEITVQGCVGRSTGDYLLTKPDPGMTYQLQATGKIKLSHYVGQQVEVTGKESPSLRMSFNSSARAGSASVALIITSIKTIEKECSV